MKLSSVFPSVFVFFLSSTAAEDAVECREKTNSCETNVEVVVTDLVFGLKDDVPEEVYEAFVTASAQCLSCVDDSDVNFLAPIDDAAPIGDDYTIADITVDEKMSYSECKSSCCQYCHLPFCQKWDGSGNYCPDQCYDHFPQCGGRRMLNAQDDRQDDAQDDRQDDAQDDRQDDAQDDRQDDRQDDDGEDSPYFVNYEVNVCMDDMTPLDASSSSYVDHTQMLADVESQLHACYEDKDAFLNSWSSLCAEDGIDLSLMARQEGDLHTIMFGQTGFDPDSAVVTYSSNDSHRSSSNMIFYSALGFLTVSVFAVVGTAVIVKILNKRREEEEAQALQWVSEMTEVENANPLSSATPPSSDA